MQFCLLSQEAEKANFTHASLNERMITDISNPEEMFLQSTDCFCKFYLWAFCLYLDSTVGGMVEEELNLELGLELRSPRSLWSLPFTHT